METTLIPLHGMYAAPFPIMGGLFVALLFVLVLKRLFRYGRLGPIRYDGRRRGPWRSPAGPAPTPEDAALATLKARLASGDITVEEYLERSSVLARTPHTEA